MSPAYEIANRITGIELDDHLKMILYGRSGSGKTTLWATFPGPTLALICSGYGGAGELRSVDTPEHRAYVKQLVVRDSMDVPNLCDYQRSLYGTPDWFETIVLDHVTGLQDLVLKEVLNLEEIPTVKTFGLATQSQFGQIIAVTKDHVRRLFELPCNVIVIAQERDFTPGGERGSEVLNPCVGPSTMPRLSEWLCPTADYVCQTFIRNRVIVQTKAKQGGGTQVTKKMTEDIEYCLRTGPDPYFITKFRTPRGVPVPTVIVDPSYEKVMDVIRGGQQLSHPK